MKKGFTRQNFSKKNLVGFTLLELLIVIGILAILSTTMILVINPAEILKKARDSQRISDLNTLKSAIAYYITSTSSPNIGLSTKTYSSNVTGASCAGRATASDDITLEVNGSGWIPINFSELTGGSPIGSLPQDPNPSTTVDGNPSRYYVYLPNASDYTFTLVANMESATYSAQEGTDGGNITTLYEVGTAMLLSTTSANCFPNPGY